MTRDEIYATSAEADALANHLLRESDRARAKAKRLRWIEAPAWANCIVSPSQSALHALHYRAAMIEGNPQYATPIHPGSPQCEDDWRWANRTNTGWLHFDNNVSTPVEAGNWTIVERRP